MGGEPLDMADLRSPSEEHCVFPSPPKAESHEPPPSITGSDSSEWTPLDLSASWTSPVLKSRQHSTTKNRCSCSNSAGSSYSCTEGGARNVPELCCRFATLREGLIVQQTEDELARDRPSSAEAQCFEPLAEDAEMSGQVEDVVSAADWLETKHALLA